MNPILKYKFGPCACYYISSQNPQQIFVNLVFRNPENIFVKLEIKNSEFFLNGFLWAGLYNMWLPCYDEYQTLVKIWNFLQIYLNNRTQIDPVLDKVKAQLNEISGKVAAMIPQAKAAEIKKTE